MKNPFFVIFLCAGGSIFAQSPAPAPSNQLTPQVLGEMLRTAATFHELVQGLNLNEKLGPDSHNVGPDGVSHHSIQRTAATVGAGAGVGAAIGSFSHTQNSQLIGALIGGAGGLIVDAIVQQHEQARAKAPSRPEPGTQQLRQ
jgi:hypothetical protein